jgi:hypothetical protein
MRETVIRKVAMTLSLARGQQWKRFPTAREVLRQARFEELAEKIVTQVEIGMLDFRWREPPASQPRLPANGSSPRFIGHDPSRPRASPQAASDF